MTSRDGGTHLPSLHLARRLRELADEVERMMHPSPQPLAEADDVDDHETTQEELAAAVHEHQQQQLRRRPRPRRDEQTAPRPHDDISWLTTFSPPWLQDHDQPESQPTG